MSEFNKPEDLGKDGGGVKFDGDKLRYDLIPADALRQLAEVYTMGAKKYDDNNWRKGIKWSRIYGAIQRHINAFWEGEDMDPESGLNHLSHAAWGCFTLLNYFKEKKEYDDRWKPEEDNPYENQHPVVKPKADHRADVMFYKPIQKKQQNIYVAGSIHATEYRKVVDELCKTKYKGRIINRDPLAEVEANIKDLNDDTQIVEQDKELILNCDILVAYVENYTPGTIMEIIYAYENGIPVYLITTNEEVKNRHWINYHSMKKFEAIEECLDYIDKNHIY